MRLIMVMLSIVILCVCTPGFAEMYLDSIGNVGVGTDTPTGKLDVFTTSGDAVIGESISGAGVLGVSSSGFAGFFQGDVRITSNLTVDGDLLSTHSHDTSYVNEGQADSVSSSMIIDGSILQTDLAFTLGDGHSLDASDGSPSDAVYVDVDGKVGLGTQNPSGQLDVAGDICLGGVCRTSWPTGSGTGAFTDTGATAYYNGGNIGIGTDTPQPLGNTDTRVLHIKEPVGLLDNTAAGIRIEVENIIEGGITSAYSPVSGDAGIFVGSLTSHRLGFITNSMEQMTLATDGNLGIGTTSPLQHLHVQGSAYVFNNLGVGIATPTHGLQVSASDALLSSETGDFRMLLSKGNTSNHSSLIFQDNFTGFAEMGLTSDNDFHFKVSADGNIFSDAMVINHTSGDIGMGTVEMTAKLHVVSSDKTAVWAENNGNYPSFIAYNNSTGDAASIYQTGSGYALVIRNVITPGSELMVVDRNGNVGIGTSTPQGSLDVNGAIYQRGSELHADYVFEPGYPLESIEEHAAYMWDNKHLKAIPKAATDENGAEIIEAGTHRRGIVEELEKAHIYIEQLLNRINEHKKVIAHMEERLRKLEKSF